MDTARKPLAMQPGQTLRISERMVWGGTKPNGMQNPGMMGRWLDTHQQMQAGCQLAEEELEHYQWQGLELAKYAGAWLQRHQDATATPEDMARMQKLCAALQEAGFL